MLLSSYSVLLVEYLLQHKNVEYSSYIVTSIIHCSGNGYSYRQNFSSENFMSIKLSSHYLHLL